MSGLKVVAAVAQAVASSLFLWLAMTHTSDQSGIVYALMYIGVNLPTGGSK